MKTKLKTCHGSPIGMVGFLNFDGKILLKANENVKSCARRLK